MRAFAMRGLALVIERLCLVEAQHDVAPADVIARRTSCPTERRGLARHIHTRAAIGSMI
jgi:hypothetical protein